MRSAWVVAVSMRLGFRFSDGSVHPEHRVRTPNVYQSKPALHTWLDRKKHCELITWEKDAHGKTRMHAV